MSLINNGSIAKRLSEIGTKEYVLRNRPDALSVSKRVMITGGAGNVGSNLGMALRKRDFNVAAFDNLRKGHRAAAAIAGARLFVGDLLDHDALTGALSEFKPDVVIHCAALIEVGESGKLPQEYINNNVVGTLNLFHAMQQLGMNRLLFSNTAAVYDGTLGRPLKETDPWDARNVYGATKGADALICKQGKLFPSLKSVHLHYFNVCGAPETGVLGEDHGIATESHIVPIILQIALYNLLKKYGLDLPFYDPGALATIYGKAGRDRLKVFGNNYNTPDGTCIRDYIGMGIKVFFHLQAIQRLLSGNMESHYEAFNLGTKKGHSVLDILNRCENVVRQQVGLPAIETHGLPLDSDKRLIPAEIAERRQGDADFLVADPEKANSILDPRNSRPVQNIDKEIEFALWSMLYRPLGYEHRPAVTMDHQVLRFYET
ncbi:MAG: GDP-mannose 4,6-dehydratase [Candidatus Saganbacteria bacterium]|nr:GDP-mannose 4,6-dehydratase [Candidatus Saganbacteria bacterium]